MAGQDACLTIAQAKAQQERICASDNHQGKKTKGSGASTELMSKQPHQG
jgi:hypothetical protein